MGKIIGDELVLLELGLSSSPTDEERVVVQQAVVKAEGAVIKFIDGGDAEGMGVLVAW